MGILEGEPGGVSLFRHQARTKNVCPYITRGGGSGKSDVTCGRRWQGSSILTRLWFGNFFLSFSGYLTPPQSALRSEGF